jgi:hypothetical protein
MTVVFYRREPSGALARRAAGKLRVSGAE